jgi:hypothetical protein
MKNRGFLALEAPPKRSFNKIHKVLFIRKTNVLLGHVCALDRNPVCARSWEVRSSACNC